MSLWLHCNLRVSGTRRAGSIKREMGSERDIVIGKVERRREREREREREELYR